MRIEVPATTTLEFENLRYDRVFIAAILRDGQWHIARWFPQMQCFVVETLGGQATTFPDAERIILLW